MKLNIRKYDDFNEDESEFYDDFESLRDEPRNLNTREFRIREKARDHERTKLRKAKRNARIDTSVDISRRERRR